MELKIFDVEHGACALLSAQESHIVIDCGHNASTGWPPSRQLRDQGIQRISMLTITNYDEDHASGLPELRRTVAIDWLWRNQSVSPDTLCSLKSEDGMGAGIEELTRMARGYIPNGAPPPVFAGVEYRGFSLNYPEFEDENNLSLVAYFKIAGHGFLFPGDLEVKGWRTLLSRDAGFRAAVKDVAVLVASHHGRENGLCHELFSEYGCSPYWVVMSDKGFMYDTQKTVAAYGGYARGGSFRGEARKVLTTRDDGRIRFWFTGDSWGAD